MNEIVKRILTLIRKRDITVYRLAKDTGLLNATLSNTLKKNSFNSSKTLLKIADYFNVSIEYLITGKEPNESDIIVKLKRQLESLIEDNNKLQKKINDFESAVRLITARGDEKVIIREKKLSHNKIK